MLIGIVPFVLLVLSFVPNQSPLLRHPPLTLLWLKGASTIPPVCATAEPQPGGLHCIQPSLQWEQEIPQVIHAAYCFLSRTQRRFLSLAPTFPFCWSWFSQTSELSPSCFTFQCFLLHKIPFMISVIRLILSYVNQFFQVVGRTHERAFQMGCFLEICPLIHFNPITAAGGLIKMKRSESKELCSTYLSVKTLQKFALSYTNVLLFFCITFSGRYTVHPPFFLQ